MVSRYAGMLSLAVCVSFATAAQAQVKLEYKYNQGQKSTYQTVKKVQQTLTLNGMDNETSNEEVVTGSSEIGKRGADGALPITQKVDGIKIQVNSGGMVFSFDTDDPNAKFDNPELAIVGDILKALAHSEFTIVLGKDNKVKTVEGTDKVLERVKDLNPIVIEGLKQRLSADRFKRAFERAHGNLPAVLAREGEPWEVTEDEDIGGGQTLTFRRRYEYKGTVEKAGNQLDRITIQALEVTYKMDPDTPAPVKVTKSDLKIDSSKGEMLFDRGDGEVVERKELNRIKGTLDLENAGQAITGMLDLTLDSATTRTPKGASK